MGVAAHHYTAIWNVFPRALRYEEVDGAMRTVAWDWVTVFNSDELVSPGALWSYTDSPGEVMQCPGYDGPTNFQGDPYTGYNYNTSYLGAEAMFVAPGWQPDVLRRGAKPTAVRRPDQCAIFGCGGYSGGTNKFMRAPLSPNGWPMNQIYAGGQAFHYNGQTNVAYVDGHVASVREPHPGENADDDLLNMLGFPRNGFLSDDDSAYAPNPDA